MAILDQALSPCLSFSSYPADAPKNTYRHPKLLLQGICWVLNRIKNFSPSLYNDIACYSWALAKMLGFLLHKSLRFQFLQVHLKLCSKKALEIIYAAKLWIQFFDILLLHPFSFLCTYIKQLLGRRSYKSAD